MSQMPNKIWLHKDTKYSTGDIVCGYQYDFVQGIEDEGGIENFVKYVPADAFIGRVARFLEYKLNDRVEIRVPGTLIPSITDKETFIEEVKKYMKGE